MKKILIVEDDRLAAELERDYLEMSGFEVEICSDGTEGLKRAQTGEHDLLLLDVMLPGVSGFEICREIRKSLNLPIILITARTEDIDKLRGLGLGADDYMVKPFNPAEMVARVQAHIRIHERLLEDRKKAEKSGKEEEKGLSVGELRILPLSRRVFVRGEEVHLKNREYALLHFLASHPGIVFSREQLLERIWGPDTEADTATVTVHINRIREKIEENPQNPQYIGTVRGAGYRLQAKH